MITETASRYREQFAQLETQFAGADLLWLQQARHAALERFCALGFPDTAQEDWKYTNVGMIAKRGFNFVPQASNGADGFTIGKLGELAEVAELAELTLSDDYLLVYINGRYAPALSKLKALPQGATVLSLAAALADHASKFDAMPAGSNGFAALNAAFWNDGAYIELAPTVEVEAPIHLLFIATEADLMTHPRHIIHAGPGARATIVEHYIGADDIAYFTNAVTQIVLEPGAAIEHYKLQQESGHAFHIASIDVQQAQNSRFTSHSFALGGLLSRNDIGTCFNQEGCQATLNGLYMASGRQHMDHHTSIDHAQPGGVSREFYKGVLGGAARAVFNGKVIVRPDAQKSDAYLSNRNLLLSDTAEVDTKPQLEIYADDVKCTHGATVGQLDENQVFYLRSRGVDAAQAITLLTYAFASEIVERVGIALLQERLEELLINRLPGGHQIRELL
ncbi:Fe-S cluster assembly protein SufD [Paraherbaspirillum soli]|uniref:Fe-S cluster assembly protein SufD n=1 Tax=Paraherbaspirillum soli TaxID=631222 RepID=A0ABW0MDG7_9BURK